MNQPLIPIKARIDNSTGLGCHALDLARSLLKLGCRVELFPGYAKFADGALPPEISALVSPIRNHSHPWELIVCPANGDSIPLSKGKITVASVFLESTRLSALNVQQLNLCDLIIAPSVFVQVVLRANGVVAPIEMVNPGVDTEVFQPGIQYKSEPERAVFGTAGRFQGPGGRRQIGQLIEAFQASAPEHALLKIKCAKGDPVFNLEDPRIKFHYGFLDDMASWYRSLGWFIAPWAEGWGRHQIEAMACGVPLAGIAYAGSQEYLHHGLNGAALAYKLQPQNQGFYRSLGDLPVVSSEEFARFFIWASRLKSSTHGDLRHEAAHTADRLSLKRCSKQLLDVLRSNVFPKLTAHPRFNLPTQKTRSKAPVVEPVAKTATPFSEMPAANLAVVLPFCEYDAEAALEWILYANEIEGGRGYSEYPLLLIADCRVENQMCERIFEAAKSVFGAVELIRTAFSLPGECYPVSGPNWMFEHVARYIHARVKRPFWWNEADCIPIRAGWLEALQREYYAAGKPYMGFRVTKAKFNSDDHINGCAVYPPNAIETLEPIFDQNFSWDFSAGRYTLPQARHTELIEFTWFKAKRNPNFKNQAEFQEVIDRGRAVVHPVKDRSVRQLAQERISQWHPSGRPYVFTYFEEIPGLEEPGLLTLWAASWMRFGWEAVVLGPEDLPGDDPDYEQAVSQFPTTNNKDYERACFRRWQAMARQGGGLMVDYDVINCGFTPTRLWLKDYNQLVAPRHSVPCFVYGSEALYRETIDTFKRAVPPADSTQVSDMTLLQNSAMDRVELDVCPDYSSHNWIERSRRFGLAHFASSFLPRPRVSKIPDLVDPDTGAFLKSLLNHPEAAPELQTVEGIAS